MWLTGGFEKWAEMWQMEFNVDKCKVVHYGKDNIWFKYDMYGHQLQEVIIERDLGVHMSSDLKVGCQCMEAYRKANQILGIINRTIRFKNPGILVSLYKTMVRPHLEFCSPAWNPYYVKDKQLLEKVQHRFMRMFWDLKSLPYEDRLRN